MRRRAEPFKIKTLTTVHNAILFFLSLYMAIETLRCVKELHFDRGQFFCLPVETLATKNTVAFKAPAAHRLARVLHLHYLSKMYEFVDTFIMILKKNNRQITFLHVYHHALTFFPFWWATVRYSPGGEAWMVCALNSFIHVLMYGYYLLAGLGWSPGLTYKKLVTRSQMLQFILIVAHASYTLARDCVRPRLVQLEMIVHGGILLALFTNFYITSYRRIPPQRKKLL